MDHLVNVQSVIYVAHTVPQTARHRWAKSDLQAQKSNSLCSEYMWQE